MIFYLSQDETEQIYLVAFGLVLLAIFLFYKQNFKGAIITFIAALGLGGLPAALDELEKQMSFLTGTLEESQFVFEKAYYIGIAVAILGAILTVLIWKKASLKWVGAIFGIGAVLALLIYTGFMMESRFRTMGLPVEVVILFDGEYIAFLVISTGLLIYWIKNRKNLAKNRQINAIFAQRNNEWSYTMGFRRGGVVAICLAVHVGYSCYFADFVTAALWVGLVVFLHIVFGEPIVLERLLGTGSGGFSALSWQKFARKQAQKMQAQRQSSPGSSIHSNYIYDEEEEAEDYYEEEEVDDDSIYITAEERKTAYARENKPYILPENCQSNQIPNEKKNVKKSIPEDEFENCVAYKPPAEKQIEPIKTIRSMHSSREDLLKGLEALKQQIRGDETSEIKTEDSEHEQESEEGELNPLQEEEEHHPQEEKCIQYTEEEWARAVEEGNAKLACDMVFHTGADRSDEFFTYMNKKDPQAVKPIRIRNPADMFKPLLEYAQAHQNEELAEITEQMHNYYNAIQSDPSKCDQLYPKIEQLVGDLVDIMHTEVSAA